MSYTAVRVIDVFLLVLGIALALRAGPPTKSSAQERMLEGKGVANIG